MSNEQRMSCMEVWGGSEAADSTVSLPGLDAWVYSRPYEQAKAGGDVYYVSSCATGRINRLLVADVSGHGEKVQAVAIQLRDLMRRYVNFLDQSRFVRNMNGRFVESSEAGCFATAVVSTFFAPTRTLSVCNAGHPPPLIYRAATREWSFLVTAGESAGNVPLGIIEYDNCDQFDVDLQVGDLVIVYTDSLIEAKSPDGTMLEQSGLLTLVRQVANPDAPQAIIPKLLATIEEKIPGGLNADDVTVLLLRPNGTGTRAHWINSFTAPFKVLGTVGRFLIGKGPISLPDPRLPNIGGAVFGPLGRLWRRKRA